MIMSSKPLNDNGMPILDIHVIDQEGQPYGSTRLCCNRCGSMLQRNMHYVAHVEEWNQIDPSQRCSIKVKP